MIKNLVLKTFSFGKVALAPYVKTKQCEVEVEIKICEQEGFPTYFSFGGGFWNGKHTDEYICGQCYEEIEEYKNSFSKKNQELWGSILYLWKKYHLKNTFTLTDKQDKELFKSLGIDITVA